MNVSGSMKRKIIRRSNIQYLIILLCILSFIIYSYPLLTSSTSPISPDELVNSYFSKIYAKTGELRYTSQIEGLNAPIVRPRGTVIVDEKFIAPGKFLGYPIIIGTIERFLPTNVSLLFLPLFSTMTIFYLFLIIKREFNEKIAFISALLGVFLSSFWYWSIMYRYEDVLAVSFFIIGLNYIFKGIDESSNRQIYLASFLLGVPVMIKPFYIISFLPLIITFLIYFKKIYIKNKISGILLSTVPFLIGIFIYLLANKITYDSWFITGFHLTYGVEGEIIPSSSNIDFYIVLNNYLDYFIFTSPISLFGLLGILKIIVNKDQKGNRLLMWFIVLSVFLTGYIFILSGASDPTNVHHSAIRYLLIIHLFLVPFAVYFVFTVFYKLPIIIVLICLIFLLSNLAIVNNIQSILDTRERYQYYSELINLNTENNSVFICQYVDKIYFPDRLTANPAFIEDDNRESKCAAITLQFIKMGYNVYLVKDRPQSISAINYTVYEEYLNHNGLLIEPFMPGLGFYSIKFNSTQIRYPI